MGIDHDYQTVSQMIRRRSPRSDSSTLRAILEDSRTPLTDDQIRDLTAMLDERNREDLAKAQAAARPILDKTGVDVAEPFDRGDWSEVYRRLRAADEESRRTEWDIDRRSDHAATWEQARAAILEVCPEADV